MSIAFDNSFARQMQGFYTPWQGDPAPAPEIVQFNDDLAQELNLDPAQWSADILSGNTVPKGAEPIAQVYAGHQFGGFSPRLGDGRALLLGELIDAHGNRRDIALKGSGATPYSRGGDGKAAIAPVLREYLIGEAMFALGIPTTRALAATLTGDDVQRERALPGAVLTRVARSHLRVGTFQYFASRNEHEQLHKLAHYAIARHHPTAAKADIPALALLEQVCKVQADLIAKWLGVGFVHGVMNTDNMTISGETIDYGPCAFLDVFHADAVFSSIDQHGRYAYAKQPVLAQWNLARLAEALLPLIDPDSDKAIALAVPVIEAFKTKTDAAWLNVFRQKLGMIGAQVEDEDMVHGFLAAMQNNALDFTGTFRKMADELRQNQPILPQLMTDAALPGWLDMWRDRIGADTNAAADRMDKVNPLYIPRNHLVENALIAATDDTNFQPFKDLLAVITDPFNQRSGCEHYTKPAPKDAAPYVTYCGT